MAFYDCTSLTSLTIPNSVTTIGDYAFYSCTSLTSLTIPNSVTTIGDWAFGSCTKLASLTLDMTTINSYFSGMTSLKNLIIGEHVKTIVPYAFNSCTSLTNVTLGNSVTSIGEAAFSSCTSLTNVTIPNSVTNIGSYAFQNCTSLTNVAIGNSVTSIGDWAFGSCTSLSAVYFKGDAPPSLGSFVFFYATNATVYYLPGKTGWTNPWQGRPAVLWNPQAQTRDASFGVRTNRFGFNITGTSNLVIVVEASTNLFNPVWQPIQTNTLNTFIGTNGTSYFSDPQWTNYPGRFYRLRSP